MYAIKIILGYRCERTRLKKERRFELQIHSNLSIYLNTIQHNIELTVSSAENNEKYRPYSI